MMQPDLTIPALFLGTSALLSFIVMIFAVLKARKTPLLASYLWFYSLICLWSVGQLLQLFAENMNIKVIFLLINYLAITFIGLSGLLFCLFYSEHPLTRQPGRSGLLFVPPIIFYMLVLTNDYHHLFFIAPGYGLHKTLYGPFFWLHALETYIYLLTGVFILLKYMLQRTGRIRMQSLLLLAGLAIPILANIFTLFHNVCNLKIIDPGVDITPFTFSFTMLLTTVALFKYKLLDLEPIAFKKIVKNMKAAVILVNDYYQIIDFNQTLAVNFPKVKIKINDNLESVFKNLQNDMEDEEVATEVLAYLGSQTKSHFKREVCFRTPVKRYFEVKIQPVFDRKKEIMAWIIVFNDISQYKYFSSQLNEKNIVLAEMNEELLALNDRLKAYADTVEELAITRERNRMARDVHDTLGHTLTVLITLLENAGLFCHKDPVETRERLVKAGQLARSGLQEIERSIAGQRPEKLESAHLHEALEKLFADYRQSGMKIKLIPEQPNSVYTPTCCDTIYSVCQEALTNSLRHGKATEAEVLLKPINGKITLHITDNGSGCEKPVAGIGLTGMKQRVASLQGNIRVGSLSPGGFRVEVELPLDYNPGLQVEV